jgi:hypothetical protein
MLDSWQEEGSLGEDIFPERANVSPKPWHAELATSPDSTIAPAVTGGLTSADDPAAAGTSTSSTGTLAWEELDRLKASAAATGCFTFAHRPLEDHAIAPLVSYLRDECRSKFVDLSGVGNWAEASTAIAGAVRNGMRSARSLLLDGNDIGGNDAVLDAWCGAFHDHPGLQHVSLRNCNISDEGVQRVSAMLNKNSVLFSIDLGWNRFGDVGAWYLSEALNENLVLLELGLDGNQVCDVHLGEIGLHLGRNGSKLKGGVQATLHDLKRARNQALSTVGFARPVDYRGPHRPQVLALTQDPFAPQDDVAAAVDKVWFDVRSRNL